MTVISAASLFQEPSLLAVSLAILVGGAVGWLVFRIGRMVLVRISRPFPLAAAVVSNVAAPARYTLMLIPAQFILRAASDEVPAIAVLRHAAAVLLILAVTWLGLRAVRGIAEGVIARHPLEVADNLLARRVQTQTRVLMRCAMVAIGLVGFAAVLMTFPTVRTVGTSLLASAGVAGLAVGMAARPVLANLIAGIQLAVTQPIRLEDVLIVEGEWGWVEEITGTYVVMRLWDWRRLVIPLQWFIEHPFQNWTRSTASIIGSVFWWVDYGLPLQPVREELERLCKDAPEWDGKVVVLQVTDTSERAMQLRALMSAPDSSKAWDLRCRVREGIIDFIQRAFPDHLPRVRAELSSQEAPVAEAVIDGHGGQ